MKKARKIHSMVVPGYSHWAAPENIQVGEDMKVPGEGIWSCLEVKEGIAVFMDKKRHCTRYLRIFNKNMKVFRGDEGLEHRG